MSTGERSQKIRTYNYPQNRVTDHRIRLTLNKLDRIIEGDLDELVTALRTQLPGGAPAGRGRRHGGGAAGMRRTPRTRRPEMRAGVERDALVVGMTLVPGFVSRNRSFALFEDPEVRRARRRAAVLRGIVRQLAGAHGHVEGLAVVALGRRVRAALPRAGAPHRAAGLADGAGAGLRALPGRARRALPGLHASEDDRARIDAALRRLAAGLRLSEIDVSA